MRRDRTQRAERRHFLFLQGPHGAFFPKLGAALVQAGHAVRRINLNGGDQATWPTGDSYRGRSAGWPDHLDGYLSRYAITDLVLFGDNRPMHAAAIRSARAAGVRVHVFEEGYIRPDWITLERDGVNGNSTLPRDPDWYRRAAASLPAVPVHPPVPSYTTARHWAAFFYHAEVVLQHWRFPFYRSHRVHGPVWEGIAHVRRLRRRRAEAERSAAALERVAGRPFFLFPLQLNSDYQIRVHSGFDDLHAAVDRVLESFARAAPADVALIVKEHPLDAGLDRWRAFVEARATRYGIADRVAFIEQGDLAELVAGARGMVTVNSTSGTLALASGKPLKALGTAIYDLPGITDQQPLDGFWRHPRAPDPAIYDAFYRVLADRCLIHGAFLSNAGIDLLVGQSLQRLTGVPKAAAVRSPPIVRDRVARPRRPRRARSR